MVSSVASVICNIYTSNANRVFQTLLDNNIFSAGILSDVAVEREVEGSLLLGDMGEGLPFRPGSFDGVIR